MKKVVIAMSIMLFVGLIVSSCASTPSESESTDSVPQETTAQETTATTSEGETSDLRVFTLAELAEYDGKEGRKAYVAVDGMVYDVTDVGAWSGGTHQRNEAGQDLSDEINNRSPHGLRVLEDLEIVGRMED